MQRSANIGTAITDAGGLEALGAALVAHPSCGKIQNNVGLALDHMETPLHPEDKAMVEGALVEDTAAEGDAWRGASETNGDVESGGSGSDGGSGGVPPGAYPHSYIEPFWDDMYLAGPWPLPVNVNPFYLLRDEDFPRETSTPQTENLLRY